MPKKVRCNYWMPVKSTECARPSGHKGAHASKAALDKKYRVREDRLQQDNEFRVRQQQRVRDWGRANPRSNTDQQRDRIKEYMRRRRLYWMALVDNVKTQSGCVICGFESNRPGYFDLDHAVPSTKTNCVSAMIGRLSPLRESDHQVFWAELAKCQVLCTACHREKTALENAQLTPGAGRPIPPLRSLPLPYVPHGILLPSPVPRRIRECSHPFSSRGYLIMP